MKIILCIPPPNAIDHPLLGIASLKGMLQAKGHEVAILDLNALLHHQHLLPERQQRKEGEGIWRDASFRQFSLPQISAFFEESLTSTPFEAEVFGFHVTSAGRLLTEELAKVIRARLPDSKIIAGGPDFFGAADEVKPSIHFDALFVGESESSLAEWLDTGCPQGIFHSSPISLDELPLPDFEGFPLSSYSRPGVLPIETARGCVNNCAFCDDSRMWGRYRAKTPKRMKIDLDFLQAKSASYLTFCDSVLNPTNDRFRIVLELLKETGLTWDGMVQARGLDDRLAADMSESGCLAVFMGIESFSQTFLGRFNKQRVSADGERSLSVLAKAGISVSMGLIVAGPPLQTRSEFEHDLRTLEKLAEHIASVAVNPLCIPSGTPLWRQGGKLGIKGLDGPQSWRFWHHGNGLADIRLRLAWCREVVDLLRRTGVSTGANYKNFDHYVEAELRDAERFLS